MSSDLLYESKNSLHKLTTTPELQVRIFNPKSKIVQNVKFSFVSQNSDLSSKSDSACQNESGCMLNFQNRALEANKSKLQAKRCNKDLSRKTYFSTIPRLTNLKSPLDLWLRNKSGSSL